MAEASMDCPGCGTSMTRVSDPDITYERCPSCDGLFFDPGELNVLATGMSGDIEFCSIVATPGFVDVHHYRRCARCRDSVMEKQGLLGDEELILDRCPACGGWFLDGGELVAMNEKLATIRRAGDAGADRRSTQRGRLVTVEEDVRMWTAASGLGASAVPTTWRILDVWFGAPWGAELVVTPRSWFSRLWSMISTTGIAFGDEDFDKAFLVRAAYEHVARQRLGADARGAMLAFQASPQAALGRRHLFSVYDDRVRYAWSTWDQPESALSDAQEADLTNALLDLADVLDPA